MRDGHPTGGAAGASGDALLIGQALAIVVELAGAPAAERMPRLVSTAQGLTGADAVAVALVGPDGRFQPGGASSEIASRLLHTELAARLGPTITCRNQARPVPSTRLTIWPGLADAARAYGISTADALPMRADGQAIGALTFYWSVPYVPTAAVADLTQALADITAIGLTADRALTDQRRHAGEQATGEPGHVVIEQARGYLAAYHRITIDEALAVLRAQAHSGGRDIHDVAAEIIDRFARS